MNITATTPLGGMEISLDLDWHELGAQFSHATSRDQARFLEGMALTFKPFAGLQSAFIADDFQVGAPRNAQKVADVLRTLVAALEAVEVPLWETQF